MKLALWEYNTKPQKAKQSSTSLNYGNDSESYDPKTRITRPQKNDKGSTQIFKSQEKSTRWLMNKDSPEPPFYIFLGGWSLGGTFWEGEPRAWWGRALQSKGQKISERGVW